MLTQLSDRLFTDGTGFVDSEWELMINRPDLRMWRRPSSKIWNGDGKSASGIYEYRGLLMAIVFFSAYNGWLISLEVVAEVVVMKV